MAHGNFHWNELVTRDVEKAKKFYGSIIGWTFDAMPMPDGTYWVAKMGDKPVGGLFPDRPARSSNGVPEHWMSYLAVDDVDARVKKGASRRRQTDAADLRRSPASAASPS